MAELPADPTRVQLSQVQFRAAANQSLTNRLGRVNNYIVENVGIVSSVGLIVNSFLTEAQFQAIRGTDWVLCDGRNVAGSDYEAITGRSSIPDVRGFFLRGKNNGRVDGRQNPAGDLALGTTQDQEYLAHTHEHILSHNTSQGNNNLGGTNFSPPFSAVYASQVGRNLTATFSGPVDVAAPHLGAEFPGGTDETRPVAVTANAFIRINA